MKPYNTIILVIVFLLLIVGCTEYPCTECTPCTACTECPSCVVSVMPYSCPVDDCRQAVVNEIDKANDYIKIAMYSFTDKTVADALVRASNRGVEVEVLLELGQISKYSQAQKLVDAGISVRQDTNGAYMHNKFVVIDDKVLMTGSVNYSGNGFDKNNENMVVIIDETITLKYKNDFDRLFSNSIDWVG